MTLTFEQYAKDVVNYLTTKLPDTPYSTVVEIAECVTAKTATAIIDAQWQRDQEWRREINRMNQKRPPVKLRKDETNGDTE